MYYHVTQCIYISLSYKDKLLISINDVYQNVNGLQ